MIVRHNTELLEKAIEHVVRRASIPAIRAEAEARRTAARATGFRRLATGGAIALAAVGIGFGIYLGNQPKLQSSVNLPAIPASNPPAALPPLASDKPPPIVPDSPKDNAPHETVVPKTDSASQPPPGVVTTNYTIFNPKTVNLLGKTWILNAGHFFRNAQQPVWEKAWCYTTVLVGDVKITIDLADRDSPLATPNAPVATEKTITEAGLQDEGALALASQCPWLDEKRFGVADFRPPPGRKNPFTTSLELVCPDFSDHG